MKGKVFRVTALFAVLMVVISAWFYLSDIQNPQEVQSEQLVLANEVEQLIRVGDSKLAAERAAELGQSIKQSDIGYHSDSRALIIGGVSLAFLMAVFGYVYFAILRPFDKMKAFAENIARGNFDIPLNYERSNYFGEFTWAFESMRREITAARKGERDAIENNKTVIATLSHDIKTPIAAIRAYAEGLEANLDATPEGKQKYLSVIMRKCDEVTKLTNDLFLHSVSDLDKLKITCEDFELCAFLENTLEEISAERGDVTYIRPNFTAVVNADKNRLTQIAENLITNSRKYASPPITVTVTNCDDDVIIHFKDSGEGIPDSDMPFIFDKFYRGKNIGNEQGSGLGLYIVRYIAEKMGGKVLLHNHSDGLEALIYLKKNKK